MKTNMMIKKELAFLLYQFCLDKQATRIAKVKSRSVMSMSIKRLFCLLLKNGRTIYFSPLISLLLIYILSLKPLKKTSPPIWNTTDVVICATVLKVLMGIDHCVEICQSFVYLDYHGTVFIKRLLSTFFFFFFFLKSQSRSLVLFSRL